MNLRKTQFCLVGYLISYRCQTILKYFDIFAYVGYWCLNFPVFVYPCSTMEIFIYPFVVQFKVNNCNKLLFAIRSELDIVGYGMWINLSKSQYQTETVNINLFKSISARRRTGGPMRTKFSFNGWWLTVTHIPFFQISHF